LFSHIVIGANDTEEAKRFYDATLGALGIEPGFMDDTGRVFYRTETGLFAITKPLNGEPASSGNGSTIGFSADSPEKCDDWHAAGVANGGEAIEDPPGVREGAGMKMYLAYLRDPAGNKVCTLYRMDAE
jgi:catechol 2,3-dioxygenase-like lactoylglutathione lyase family enzyme